MRWYKCCSPVTLCLHGESRTISRLTEARATRAKLPQTGQAFEWCSEIGGFGCRLLYTGVRSWIVQLRYQSKTHRITLGKIGTLPFEGPPDHPGAADLARIALNAARRVAATANAKVNAQGPASMGAIRV